MLHNGDTARNENRIVIFYIQQAVSSVKINTKQNFKLYLPTYISNGHQIDSPFLDI